MFSTSYSHQRSQSLDFSMQTSSGDRISLHAFSDKSASLETIKDKDLQSMTLSLKESYGYDFSYKGDGLDAQDIKEVKQALEKIKPLMSFLNPAEKFEKSDKNILDKAMDINAQLPKAKDNNMANYLKDSLATMMDEMTKAFKANDEIVTLAHDVFEALQRQMDGLDLYA